MCSQKSALFLASFERKVVWPSSVVLGLFFNGIWFTACVNTNLSGMRQEGLTQLWHKPARSIWGGEVHRGMAYIAMANTGMVNEARGLQSCDIH